MHRRRLVAAALALTLTLAACSDGDSGDGTEGGPLPDGTAITVGATKVSAADFVRDLRVIAANRELAKVLKKQDETDLVPKPGTVDPLLAQAWVNSTVNSVLIGREFERRGLEVTAADRRKAQRN